MLWKGKKTMTAFLLKLIAVFSMLLDHTLKILPAQTILTETFGMSAQSSRWLLMAAAPLGRLAFPIFAFFIAEGCLHTHSPQKYAGRLLLFGLISEVPFRLALSYMPADVALRLWPIRLTNVFFTLAFGALACFACKALREKGHPILALLPVLPLAALAEVLHTDYGFYGVLAVFAAYAVTNKLGRLGAMAGVLAVLYLGWPVVSQISYIFSQPNTIFGYAIMLAFALLALVPLYFYNGQRGKNIKWAFYIFYPAHIAALYLIKYFCFPQFLITY